MNEQTPTEASRTIITVEDIPRGRPELGVVPDEPKRSPELITEVPEHLRTPAMKAKVGAEAISSASHKTSSQAGLQAIVNRIG